MDLIEAIEGITALYHGGHDAADECGCAAETVRRRLHLSHGTGCPDDVPLPARPLWGMVVPFNDTCPSASPERRAEVMKPLLLAIARAERAPVGGWGFPLADWAVRRVAPRALRSAGLEDQAAALEALAPVVDAATAAAAQAGAWAAAEAARAAARAAASETAWAELVAEVTALITAHQVG